MGIYDRLRLPRTVATEFIGEFMMAEYALKCSGFVTGNNSAVSADWDRYSEAISNEFDRINNPEFREAVNYLITQPPRKQALRRGVLEWKTSPPPPDRSAAFQALLMVRRVRNNLFHGGKFGDYSDDFYDRGRDERLVKAAAVVLRQALAQHHQVDHIFRYEF